MKFSWVLVRVLIHLSHSSNLVVPVLLFPQFTKGPLRLKDFTYGGGACCWERFEHRQAKTPLPLLWHLLLFPNGSWSLELFVSTSHLLCVRNSLCNCMLTTQFVQYSGSPAEVSCESRITVPFPEMHRTQNCPEWIQTSGAKIHLHRGIRSAIYGSPGARGQFPGEGGAGNSPSLVEQVIDTVWALSAVATIFFCPAGVSLHLETGLPCGEPMSHGGCELNFPYLGLKPDGDWTPTTLYKIKPCHWERWDQAVPNIW